MEDYEIVYAADDDFASIMGVSLLSLLENNQDLENLRVTIFDSGISDENKEKVEEIFQKYNRKMPRWIKPIDLEKKVGLSLDIARGSLAVYSRLFLSDYFDSNVKKILYIDSDTIIVSSIKKLLETNLHGNVIGATKDAFSKFYRKNIEIGPYDAMINAGVFLVDLDEWKNKQVEKKILNYIIRKKGKVQLNDQGVLNHVLDGKIDFIDPKYNMISLYYEYTYSDMVTYRKPVNFYSEEEIEKAKSDPVIIHYTSAFNTVRPWFENSTHPETNEWLSYYRRSPWKNVPLVRDSKSGVKKIIFKIYGFLPQKIALAIASVFQIYIRPLKNRLVNR